MLAPESLPFENTATTAAIACFRIGEQPESVRFRAVHSLTAIADLATEGR